MFFLVKRHAAVESMLIVLVTRRIWLKHRAIFSGIWLYQKTTHFESCGKILEKYWIYSCQTTHPKSSDYFFKSSNRNFDGAHQRLIFTVDPVKTHNHNTWKPLHAFSDSMSWKGVHVISTISTSSILHHVHDDCTSRAHRWLHIIDCTSRARHWLPIVHHVRIIDYISRARHRLYITCTSLIVHHVHVIDCTSLVHHDFIFILAAS